MKGLEWLFAVSFIMVATFYGYKVLANRQQGINFLKLNIIAILGYFGVSAIVAWIQGYTEFSQNSEVIASSYCAIIIYCSTIFFFIKLTKEKYQIITPQHIKSIVDRLLYKYAVTIFLLCFFAKYISLFKNNLLFIDTQITEDITQGPNIPTYLISIVTTTTIIIRAQLLYFGAYSFLKKAKLPIFFLVLECIMNITKRREILYDILIFVFGMLPLIKVFNTKNILWAVFGVYLITFVIFPFVFFFRYYLAMGSYSGSLTKSLTEAIQNYDPNSQDLIEGYNKNYAVRTYLMKDLIKTVEGMQKNNFLHGEILKDGFYITIPSAFIDKSNVQTGETIIIKHLGTSSTDMAEIIPMFAFADFGFAGCCLYSLLICSVNFTILYIGNYFFKKHSFIVYLAIITGILLINLLVENNLNTLFPSFRDIVVVVLILSSIKIMRQLLIN